MKLILKKDLNEHTDINSRWIAINGFVYDVTDWQHIHPGGAKIIAHYSGQDASAAWMAMHSDKLLVKQLMNKYIIGKLDCKQDDLTLDFLDLHRQLESKGYFKSNSVFFILHLLHILVLEFAAYYFLKTYGVSVISFFVAAVILATAQAQSGWSQHDYGHRSVFEKTILNQLMHYFVIGHLKGASSHWWNFRHYQHHVKPNIIGKDPDVTFPYLFLLGNEMPIKWAMKNKGIMPYQWQHIYFWMIGPPLLLPIYFHYENLYFVFKRKNIIDFALIVSFFCRFSYFYSSLLGHFGAFALYMIARVIESHWFVLVTQMNHIPMDIKKENLDDWLTNQMRGTCNVESNTFNDWFTGHLNFQIEHHLFPTMPRHNYIKVAPLVRALALKHNLPYIVKPLTTAIADIHRSLEKSGNLWMEERLGHSK